MQYRTPQIDITPVGNEHALPSPDRPPWLGSKRLMIFIIAFPVCALITLSYVFSRPAIYLSYATLLTVAETAIDQRSSDADIQHVAIQKQILFGAELLAETAKRLQSHHDLEGNASNLTVADIRNMLDVRSVVNTNLVEMVAEGSEPDILPALINTWIDVYLQARAEEISRSMGTTAQMLQAELAGLSEKINLKRAELEQFRENNNILSSGREENEALARLKGLNDSLNKASEEEVKAKAKLDSIKKAISRGQTVVPKEDTRTLSLLENRAQELREELEELDRRFTREYMALTPSLKVIPEKLANLQAEIERMRKTGQDIVISEAEQEYVAARQTTQAVREQLEEHRRKAAEFTARFAEHEALKNDLEGMEKLFREAQERLVQIETKYAGKYPQVNVVEWAFLPHNPIRPDYRRDAIIALVGSLLFALFCVWMVEFLTRRERAKLAINLSGIHVYGNEDSSREAIDRLQFSRETLAQSHQYALKRPLTREVSPGRIDALLGTANKKEQQLVALLLSGLTLEEIAALQAVNIDLENDALVISGTSPRKIPLNPLLKTLYLEVGYCLVSPSGQVLTRDDLAALLTCAIVDAGMSVADDISAASLRYTYIAYLVRQGARLSDLEKIVGYISPSELSTYSMYSPAGSKREIHEINLLYPMLVQHKK
ncbi:integrase [Nitrosomonas sp. Nm132]|jgi:uncharacterized protein involved in exopolysaccharide biosynthesis|uniref:GumC family protein n=1 Tax=Nitrosomonas sp. Nm132 TaxID=1881053 RepID=UPI0008918B84|nr:integrase [Nitrosomonas sp. Nm132]SDG89443.1 Uncharacterized protein involved in exopolysaccharide biosynthesis [Nitrosomonas sp. Nm132]